MSNKIHRKNKRGFTIIEVIAAVFVITIGVVGVANIIPQIIVGTSLNVSKLTASYLAQEGFEIVRNIRDGNWLKQRTDPSILWYKNLDGCSSGCEADYTILTSLDPTLNTFVGNGRKLLVDSNNGFYSYVSGGVPSKFSRKITIVKDGSNDFLTITVLISWDERGPKTFSAQEKLYKWR